MPPVDLASGDKHAPVKPAAARRPAVAPVSDGPAWKRPSFWLVQATIETPACGTGTLIARRGPSKKKDRRKG